MIKDIHTHHAPPQPEAVVSVSPPDFNPLEAQLYSVGIHPWSTGEEITPEMWERLEEAVAHPQVVAVGECGIDLLKGAPMFRQLQVFRRHYELSEKYGKPLIIHDVRAHDIILGLKRDLKPAMGWCVHGFRAKPTVAKMLCDAGIFLSFGEYFNAESLRIVPDHLVLAETDESSLTIEEIITRISETMQRDMESLIIENSARFLGKYSL